MAKIDLKNATIKIWDGTLGTLTTTNTGGDDGKILLTAKSKHVGTNKIALTLVDPGEDSSIGVVVTGRSIVVTLAYATGAITTTATLLAAAIDGDSDATALVTVTQVGTGADTVEAQAITTVDGQLSMTITIGEGTISFSEKKPREFVKDRGNLDTVRNADQEPMDVSFDFIWDFIVNESGGSTPTVEEALKYTGVAVTNTWLTTASDVCQPYCVNIEIVNAPECTTVEDEYTMIEEFYYESLDHDAKEGTVSCSGRSNRVVAVHTRAA